MHALIALACLALPPQGPVPPQYPRRPAPAPLVAPCHHPQPPLTIQPAVRWMPFPPVRSAPLIPARPGFPAVNRAGSYCPPGGT